MILQPIYRSITKKRKILLKETHLNKERANKEIDGFGGGQFESEIERGRTKKGRWRDRERVNGKNGGLIVEVRV
jgi:hypothetical protein